MEYWDITREGVIGAIKEFDSLGREPFLAQYGYGPAKEWFLVYKGKYYDSKAIFGVAQRHSDLGMAAAESHEFTGGKHDVVAKLEKLGFEVVSRPQSKAVSNRNPPWTREELILALNFYLVHSGDVPSKKSEEVRDLSHLLNKHAEILGRSTRETFRSENSVYMKLMNFRRLDPAFYQSGRSGLSHGGKREVQIWNEFANDKKGLANTAKQLIAQIEVGITDDGASRKLEFSPLEEDSEGGLLRRVHNRRERSGKLSNTKKKKFLEANGRLYCEACRFDFGAFYGERGEGFIECHHTVPVSKMKKGDKTHLKDLILLCSNCHRIVHRQEPWLSFDELRELLNHNV